MTAPSHGVPSPHRRPTSQDPELLISTYLAEARQYEIVPPDLCAKLARCCLRAGRVAEAARWVQYVVDGGEDFIAWSAAAATLKELPPESWPRRVRQARLAVLGSYTTTQFSHLLWLAAMRLGIALDTYESPYGQYRQEVLNGAGAMYAVKPDFVLFAVHEGELALPEYTDSPEAAVSAEVERWVSLWNVVAANSNARVIQHNFAIAAEGPFGHLAARLRGSRHALAQSVNAALGAQAGPAASIVDCDRLASDFGKRNWFDPRYWHMSKQAIALSALPLLARHTAAVLAADMGLSRKCLVLDLDNTLWGGIIGEDGLSGIRLGGTPEGEAYAAFQEYVLKLKNRGVIIAVCSKNNDADAREPFEKHPEMRIRLNDIAWFAASWSTKPECLRAIAEGLGIGLDSLVFVDDNPAERQAVRQALPEVDVITLPDNPAGYIRALADYLMFETSWFTQEDAQRSVQYQVRQQIASSSAAAASLEEFYQNLDMRASISPFNELDMPRIAQLIGKSNQFNLTTRRHTLPQLNALREDAAALHFTLRLVDRFADHGLVGVMIAVQNGPVLDIDTWLMSCRVIGRTVEAEMLQFLCAQAQSRNCTAIQGTYIPTAKNAMAKEIFAKFGFELVDNDNGTTRWRYDLCAKGPVRNEFIKSSIAAAK